MDARARSCSALAALPLLAACSGSGEVLVAFPPGIAVIGEIEPNDFSWEAQPLGLFGPGSSAIVQASSCGVPCDPADGFALTIQGPALVEFELVAADPSADLDVCVYDPELGGFAFCFEAGGPVEQGSFAIDAPAKGLHLVVMPFSGGGAYSLSIAVGGYAYASAAGRPGAELRPRAAGAAAYRGAVSAPALERARILVLDDRGELVAEQDLWIPAADAR